LSWLDSAREAWVGVEATLLFGLSMHYALYPHMSVFDNLAYGLLRGVLPWVAACST